MKVPTALHDITPLSLQVAAGAWRDRLASLGHPLVGVAVGGDLRGRPFSETDAERLTRGLQRLRRDFGASLAITPSRRTPPSALALITKTFEADERVFVWDLKGDNPYRGILALADSLVVTTDSVSMVSEAIATGRPVFVLDLDFPRHRSFVQNLVDQGLAIRFDGSMPQSPAPGPGFDSMTRVANRVRKLVQARTGVMG
jgi:mitochondrial fission protein ELM1